MGAQKFQLVLKFSRNGSFSLKCFAIPNKKNSDDFSTLFRELKIQGGEIVPPTAPGHDATCGIGLHSTAIAAVMR